MIQRMQTIYMLITSILMVLMLCLPLGRFLGADHEFVLTAFGIKAVEGGMMVAGTIYMGILIVMAAVLPFINIFLFKNRLLQIRLCFMEMVFLLGVQVFVVYYLYHATSAFNELTNHSVAYSVADALPIVGLVLMWLALRGIVKDEKLVRSLNRIR